MLSRRAVLEEERKEQRQEILDRLQPGLVVEGQISNIVDFGAFVDLNGIDGLIHISELSWSHVNHPTEILNIGDTVQVKVLDIDRDRQRISLGLKQTQEDPWQRVVDTYRVGDELEGTVTKVVTFGAFVEILDGVEGLVHISELANHHVENPREVVQPGDDVRVKILEIDSERRRLSLSVKRVEGQELPRRAPELQASPEGAGDLDDVPSLGLSEDVFAPPPTRRARRAPRAGRTRSPPSPRPRCRPRSRRPRRPWPMPEAPAEEPAAEAAVAEPEAPAEEPAAEAAVAEPEAPPRSRRPRRPWPSPRRRPRSRRPRPSRRRPPRSRRPRPRRSPPATTPRRPPSRAPRASSPRSRCVAGPAGRDGRRAVPFVGLTGGLGAGKSTALAALERLGAATLSTDAVVHDLYATDEVRDAVVARWGADVAPDGVVDRPAVARHAFADPAERAWLEGLLWPLVGARVAAFREAALAADPPPRRGGGRDAAALRGRPGRRLRRDHRRRGRRGRARRAGRRPRPCRRRRARRAPAHAGREGAARDVRRRKLRHRRGPRTTAVRRPRHTVGAVPVSTRTTPVRHTAPRRRAPARASAARRRALRRRRVGLLAGVALLVALAAAVLWPAAHDAVQEITLPLRHEDIIRQQAKDKDLDPALIAGVIYAESKFRDGQQSPAGAVGLMQLTPRTARDIARKSGGTAFEEADLATPQVNIAYGAFYLRYLLDRYGGNEAFALAAYNGGEGNVDRWIAAARAKGAALTVDDIPFAETRAYVGRVQQARDQYRSHYAAELGLG